MIKNEWIVELTNPDQVEVLFKRENGVFELNKDINISETDFDKFKTYSDDMSNRHSVLFLSEMNRNKKIADDSII